MLIVSNGTHAVLALALDGQLHAVTDRSNVAAGRALADICHVQGQIVGAQCLIDTGL